VTPDGIVGLPSGTITFLFSDIEGSTALLKALRGRYGEVLADHRRLLRAAFEERGGREIDTQGDAFFVAFGRAVDAVEAAAAAQRALSAHPWPDGSRVRVRMGLHTGEPTVDTDRYVGLGVHRAARICAAGHGGQVLLSNTTRELVEDDLPDDLRLRDLGKHRLKDLDRPERLAQLLIDGLPSEFPRLRTLDSTIVQRAGFGCLSPRATIAGLVAALLILAAIVFAVVRAVSSPEAATASAVVPVDSVVQIDPKENKTLGSVSVGATPRSVVAGAGAVWVANFQAETVSRIDVVTEQVGTIGVNGHPTGLAVSDGAIWVANGFEGMLVRIDARTSAVLKTIPVGHGSSSVAAGAGAIWVANTLTNKVLKVDPDTNTVVREIPVGDEPRAVGVGEGSIWAANELGHSVTRIDDSGGAPTTTPIGLRFAPYGLATGAGAVWVTSPLDDTVSRIDPQTNDSTTIAVGNGPIGIAVGAGAVWVANGLDGTVSRIDPVAKRVVKTIEIGNSPEGVAVSQGGLWVTVHSQ
jgi:YVTN family beta-propeller protein